MEEIIKLMKKRVATLKRAVEKAKRDTTAFPDGHLRISISKTKKRYYLMTNVGDTRGKYIKVKDRAIVPKLAQKDYRQKFLSDAATELARLEQTIELFSKSNADLSYQKLSDHRQTLITPYLITSKLYAQTWQSQTIKPCTYIPENLVYETKRGEKVRSKSEAIIADILYDLQIPYFYEKSLLLKNGMVRYPDFTILHTRKRTEFYLEHFGLLDNENYLAANLHKLDEYRESGIYLGRNLLFTYETKESPLDIKGIRKMLQAIFLLDNEA
ncbi:MAG: hypothetical protein IJ716_09930 [Lachnospiraceae bacterium]|nr:hypothetical protein [Lachnospiraceae bacterium]